MSSTNRTAGDDGPPLRLTDGGGRIDPPQIAVLLDRKQAYAASVALVDTARQELDVLAGYLGDDAGNVEDGGARSVDAQGASRRLARTLGALEQIGWPHAHAWPDCDHVMREGEGSRTPWGTGQQRFR